MTEITSPKINNIQNAKVVVIDCSIDNHNGDILAGLLVVDARTSSPQTITDLSTGFRYSVQLPEQVENQGLVSSLDNCKLMILGFGDEMNRKPFNPNYARRLPANCCLICGYPLGNFHPTLANHALRHWQTDKLLGWGCPECCADEPPP